MSKNIFPSITGVLEIISSRKLDLTLEETRHVIRLRNWAREREEKTLSAYQLKERVQPESKREYL